MFKKQAKTNSKDRPAKDLEIDESQLTDLEKREMNKKAPSGILWFCVVLIIIIIILLVVVLYLNSISK